MSGQPTSERLRDTAARWEEYGETNTLVGVLCDLEGGYCAQGEILHHDGWQETIAYNDTPVFLATYGRFVAGDADREVAGILGIEVEEAAMIRVLNDNHGRRPVKYVRLLADAYAARERIYEAASLVVGA